MIFKVKPFNIKDIKPREIIMEKYTKDELLDLLLGARNILHKQEVGEEVSVYDITDAHDRIDIVIDAIIMENVDVKTF